MPILEQGRVVKSQSVIVSNEVECTVATNPTSEETAMIKREWWRPWEESEVPKLDYIIQSYDTAYSKKETADYSAITTWGVFEPKKNGEQHLIMLDAKKGVGIFQN